MPQFEPLSEDPEFLAALARGEQIRKGKSPAELAALEAESVDEKPFPRHEDNPSERPPTQAQA